MTQRIRILIADDHTMVRQGLTQICNAEPDMEVVGQAADGQEASRLALQLEPHVVVMDINMPVLDGVQATSYITENAPAVGVLILTMYRQDQYVFEAIKAGARAYLLKDADSDELLRSIRIVASGEALLDPSIALKMMDEFRRMQQTPERSDEAGQEIAQLSDREREILKLVAQGLDNGEIGDRLGLSEKTIRNRLTQIFEKLQVNNRIQATLVALRQGLASLEEDET
jgi:NarL family two-component system response regulator LiaR